MADIRHIEIINKLSESDLNLTSVYSDYPKSCLPTKLALPSSDKGKRALFENIDENLYEEGAHMVAFRTSVNKLVPWIKCLQLLYYEHYGKLSNYTVYWFDEPDNWSSKMSGNRKICIELSTKADTMNPLLYKITVFINTGLIQIQGTHKDTFVTKDFPVLLAIVNKVVDFNTSCITDVPTDCSVSEINTDNLMTTKASKKIDNDDQTMVKHVDKVTEPKRADKHEDIISEKIFKIRKIIKRKMMQAKVMNLIKSVITNSQKSLKTQPETDKFNGLISSLEKENITLKSAVQELRNESLLSAECWKSKMETQKSQIEQQKQTYEKSFKDLQIAIDTLQIQIQGKDDEITNIKNVIG
ncbi:CLIP1 [Mytilus coruscus]|uniref:CLIP1 n=1 Tax=Mytilus coruscus TaxID=42192 RepID=A0A6J8BAM1_MYTCO|nr:CLIP1 [Mytilus coruscus]